MANNTTTSALRAEHAAWSQETFGNVGPVGPLKHLSKEAQEAAQNPTDLSEWADITMLIWDAQRRAGITDEQLMQAVAEKLAINKQREWPAPCDGEPREHIRGESNNAQPSESLAWINEDELPANYPYDAMYPHSRVDVVRMFPVFGPPAAALDIASDVRAVVQLLSEGEWAEHCTKTDLGQQLEAEITRLVGAATAAAVPVAPDEISTADISYSVGQFRTHRECYRDGWNACRAAMLQSGNSPVIPDGWIPCSERMPEYGASADGGATGCLVLYERDATPDGGFNVGVWNVVYLRQCWNGIVSHWMPLPTPPTQEDGQ